MIDFYFLVSILVRRNTPIRSGRSVEVIINTERSFRLANDGWLADGGTNASLGTLATVMNRLRLFFVRFSTVTRSKRCNAYARSIQMGTFLLRNIMLNRSYFVRRVRNFLRNMLSVFIVEDRYRRRIIRTFSIALHFGVRNFFRNNSLGWSKRVTVRCMSFILDVGRRASYYPGTKSASRGTSRGRRQTSSNSRLGLIFRVFSCRVTLLFSYCFVVIIVTPMTSVFTY